ncbi:MAG: HEPN domain-containing protein [Pseudolabrys sp.]
MAGHVEWWKRASEEIETAYDLRATGKRLQAYHHAGQAIEFALKAIYIKKNNLTELPATCHGATWHNLTFIANEAGLRPDLHNLRENKRGYENWLTVKDWDSDGRFPGNEPGVKELNDLMLAVVAEPDGMKAWLDEIYQKN